MRSGGAVGEGVCGGEPAACRVPRPLIAGDDARYAPPAPSSSLKIANHKSPITSLLWFLLSAAACMMLMATTNELCQEVAAIPFLWVLPLCLYLLTFILVFQSDRLYNRAVFGPLLLLAFCGAAYVLFKGFVVPIWI